MLMVQMASRPGTIRLWIGAENESSLPAPPVFTISEQPVSALRNIMNWEMVRQNGTGPGIATGVWELDVPPSPVRVSVNVGERHAASRTMRALPDRLPEHNDSFNILLGSCFDTRTSRGMIGATIRREMHGTNRPDLVLWMGDQVYLDQPPNRIWHKDAAMMAQAFEQTYFESWFADHGLRAVLESGPGIFTPDDHEYWNNYPSASVVAPRTLFSGGMRNLWGQTARRMFERFQLGAGVDPTPKVGTPISIDLNPISMMVLDTRSDRLDDQETLFNDLTATALQAWAQRVADSPDLDAGILVLGASLLDDPEGSIKGRVGDYMLADYATGYRKILACLDTLVAARKKFILLTGDVHWGRVTALMNRSEPHGSAVGYEVIASPLSLVETPGRDAWRTVKGWFAPNEPWPKHNPPPEPPQQVPSPKTIRHIGTHPRFIGALHENAGQRGDHLAMLTLQRFGSGAQATVRAIPIGSDNEPLQAYALHQPLDLRVR